MNPPSYNQSLYAKSELTDRITLPITAIGKNLKQTLEEIIKFNFEGKCCAKGYVKHNSCKIKSWSEGILIHGGIPSYQVVFDCEICYPVEGMIITCIAKNINLAGISGTNAYDDVNIPLFVLVPRDYHKDNRHFNQINIGDIFHIKVIGTQMELDDNRISVLGELYTLPKQ